MTAPVLTFFNNKGGVGKTTLLYHLAWMLSDLGRRVLVCDFDPQANLTSAFLDEEALAELWEDADRTSPTTIYGCVRPLRRTGDVREPVLRRPTENLALLPGDLLLAGFEETLSSAWPESLGSGDVYRAMMVLTSLWHVAQRAAAEHGAELILADVGPNLGAINRSSLIGTDFVAVPLGADIFSLQGLRNLGPTLVRWREEWKRRVENYRDPEFELPRGRMQPVGYLVQQYGVRLSRPVQAYDRWVRRIPGEYAQQLLGEEREGAAETLETDPNCLATLKHYRSLVPMAQEARKPIFHLTAADGAIGNHALAVQQARADFEALAEALLARMGSLAP